MVRVGVGADPVVEVGQRVDDRGGVGRVELPGDDVPAEGPVGGPGVEVRPLRQITGDPEFNEIFFTDVRVPRDSMLGQPGEGWNVAMTTLLHERGTLGFALTAGLEKAVNRLVQLAKEPGPDGTRPADDPVVRDQIAQFWIDLQGLRFTNYRSLTTLQKTGVPGPEGSMAKLHWSETNQRLTSFDVEIRWSRYMLLGLIVAPVTVVLATLALSLTL